MFGGDFIYLFVCLSSVVGFGHINQENTPGAPKGCLRTQRYRVTIRPYASPVTYVRPVPAENQR